MTSSSTSLQYLPQHRRADNQMFRLAISYRYNILRPQSITLGFLTFQLANCPLRFLPNYQARYLSASQAIITNTMAKTKKQRALSRASRNLTNPNKNQNVIDGPEALRASVDAEEVVGLHTQNEEDQGTPSSAVKPMSDSSLSELSPMSSPSTTNHAILARSKARSGDDGINKESTAPNEGHRYQPVKEPAYYNPEAEIDEEADEEEVQDALSRVPPVDSDYLPLPWKGRLGYVRKENQSTSKDF